MGARLMAAAAGSPDVPTDEAAAAAPAGPTFRLGLLRIFMDVTSRTKASPQNASFITIINALFLPILSAK